MKMYMYEGHYEVYILYNCSNIAWINKYLHLIKKEQLTNNNNNSNDNNSIIIYTTKRALSYSNNIINLAWYNHSILQLYMYLRQWYAFISTPILLYCYYIVFRTRSEKRILFFYFKPSLKYQMEKTWVVFT